MNSNQINTSGNGSIVAISLAVITSVTTVVTTIVNKDDDSGNKPKVVASTVVAPSSQVPTERSLRDRVDSLTKRLDFLEDQAKKYREFNNETRVELVELLDLEKDTKSAFYSKVTMKYVDKFGYLRPVTEATGVVLRKLIPSNWLKNLPDIL